MKGKRKGDTLELFSTPLSEIPLRILNTKSTEEISDLTKNILNLDDKKEIIKNSNQIDSVIYKAYQLSNHEVDYIEEYFSKKN